MFLRKLIVNIDYKFFLFLQYLAPDNITLLNKYALVDWGRGALGAKFFNVMQFSEKLPK